VTTAKGLEKKENQSSSITTMKRSPSERRGRKYPDPTKRQTTASSPGVEVKAGTQTNKGKIRDIDFDLGEIKKESQGSLILDDILKKRKGHWIISLLS